MAGAITAAVIVAGGAAYAANKAAKAQKEAAKLAAGGSTTNQTTKQTPYGNDYLQGDVNAILEMQRRAAQQGAPQIGPGGALTYARQGGGMTSAAQPSNAAVVPAGYRKNAQGKVVPIGLGDARKNGTPLPGAKSATTPTAPPKPTGPQTPEEIFRQVAQQGLNAGNTQTQAQARAGIGNVLGAAGGGGPEHTGFEGYNPVLDRLTGRLETSADQNNARDLLLGFLNENARGGGGASAASPTSGSNKRVPGDPYSGRVAQMYTPSGPGGTNTGIANFGGVPDTMVPESFFGTQTRKMFDEQANEGELAALIDAMNKDTERGMFRDLAQLDAAAQGSGRFGGDMFKGMNSDARRAALEEMAQSSAGIRVGDREARRQALLANLGMVNQRDLGLLGANVQREGIAAGERSSSAASAAAAAGQADQLALARRGQDLSALGALMDNEQFGLGQLGQIGGQLSQDRINTLGLVPGLEGIGLQGLNIANAAGGGMVDMRGQDTSRSIANMQTKLGQQQLNQQAGIFNAQQQQQQVNDYLRTVLGIGGLGGTTQTNGTNTQPVGALPNGTANAIVAGLGAGLSTYGSMGGSYGGQPQQPQQNWNTGPVGNVRF